jgi:transketolase
MRDVFIRTLTAMAGKDSRVLLVTGDLGFGVLTDFATRLPRQYLNVGVAEQNMAGVAAGLAMTGRTVFTYSIANFPTLRCYEQIRNDICYHNANVKIVSIGGGFSYGSLGASHHATEDIAVMRVLPNMTCLVPSDDFEVEQATQWLVQHRGPAFLRLDKTSIGYPTNSPPFEPDKMRLVRPGSDVTVVTAGGIMQEVLRAADALEADGISCRILSFHTVSSVDSVAVLSAARETSGIVTVEEHSAKGGIGGALAEHLLEAGVPLGFFRRMGLSAEFVEVVGDQAHLRSRCGLDASSIASTIKRAMVSAGIGSTAARGRR